MPNSTLYSFIFFNGNSKNMQSKKDVLAAGYESSVENSNVIQKKDGLILFWSLRNFSYPEKILEVSASVTAIDYSTDKSSLLAVGMKDGIISVFDTMRKGECFNEEVVTSGNYFKVYVPTQNLVCLHLFC